MASGRNLRELTEKLQNILLSNAIDLPELDFFFQNPTGFLSTRENRQILSKRIEASLPDDIEILGDVVGIITDIFRLLPLDLEQKPISMIASDSAADYSRDYMFQMLYLNQFQAEAELASRRKSIRPVPSVPAPAAPLAATEYKLIPAALLPPAPAARPGVVSRPLYRIQEGIGFQLILSLQKPEIDLDPLSDEQFNKLIQEDPTPGGTAQKIFRRDKDKVSQQELLTLPRNPKDARLKNSIHSEKREKAIKIYLIGHCAAGQHYLSGTNGRWTVDNFADFIDQNFKPSDASVRMRISIIACHGGSPPRDGSQKSFAEALFAALQTRFDKRQIANVNLEIVARTVNVSRATSEVDYTAQNKHLIMVRNDGTFPLSEDVLTNFQSELDLHNMIDAERFTSSEEYKPASSFEERKVPEPTPGAAPAIVASPVPLRTVFSEAPALPVTPFFSSIREKKGVSLLEPYQGDIVSILDFDGVFTKAEGQVLFDQPFFKTLFTDGSCSVIKSLSEVRRILDIEFKKSENAKFRLRSGVVSYLTSLPGHVCILSLNHSTYIKALLLMERCEEEVLNKLFICDRQIVTKYGSKGAVVDQILRNGKIQHAMIVDDELEQLKDIKNHIEYLLKKSSPPRIVFCDRLPMEDFQFGELKCQIKKDIFGELYIKGWDRGKIFMDLFVPDLMNHYQFNSDSIDKVMQILELRTIQLRKRNDSIDGDSISKRLIQEIEIERSLVSQVTSRYPAFDFSAGRISDAETLSEQFRVRRVP